MPDLSRYAGSGGVAPGRRALIAGLAAGALPGTAPAQPAGWPQQPIRVIVAFAAGSGTDTRARLIAEPASSALGQPMVIDNRGGANGFLAAEAVARARPDGYTILFTSNSTHAANPALFRQLPYDPIGDFAPLALVGVTPLVVVVNRDLPVRTLRELADYSKAHPGRLNYGSGNTSSRIGAEMFRVATGADLTYVSYRSNPQVFPDLIAGTTQVMFSDAISAVPQVRDGRLRAIAVTGPQRIAALPDVPTADSEPGLGGFEIGSWTALFAPARTPQAVVARLSDALREILRRPDIRARMGEDGTEFRDLSPEDVAAFVESEIAKWKRVVAQAGIEVAP